MEQALQNQALFPLWQVFFFCYLICIITVFHFSTRGFWLVAAQGVLGKSTTCAAFSCIHLWSFHVPFTLVSSFGGLVRRNLNWASLGLESIIPIDLDLFGSGNSAVKNLPSFLCHKASSRIAGWCPQISAPKQCSFHNTGWCLLVHITGCWSLRLLHGIQSCLHALCV